MKNNSNRIISVVLSFAVLFTIVFTGCTKEKTDKKPILTTEASKTTTAQSSAPVTEATLPQPPESDDEFVKISDYDPTIKIDLRYSTDNNFTGKVVYSFTDAYIRYGTMKKLIAVQKELAENGVGLCVWDGYRPLSGQEALYYAADPEDRGTYVAYPDPQKGGPHCRGNTVDVTLYDLETGKLLEMPSEFDDFSTKAHPDKLEDDSQQVRDNVTLLINTMKNNGFKTISSEWWHFQDTTDYSLSDFDPAEVKESEQSSTAAYSEILESLTDAIVVPMDTFPAE